MGACRHVLFSYAIISMKISSKQNTLMKWFGKSPKKEKSQKEIRSREEEEEGGVPGVGPSSSKKQKLEE